MCPTISRCRHVMRCGLTLVSAFVLRGDGNRNNKDEEFWQLTFSDRRKIVSLNELLPHVDVLTPYSKSKEAEL